MKIPKIIYSFLVLLFILPPSSAAISPVPARIISLGGGGVALKDISMPLAVNPGSMAHREGGRISLLYGSIEGNRHLGAVEYVYPFLLNSSMGAGVSADYLSGEDYILNYLFGAGFKFGDNFSAGVSAIAAMEYSSGHYAEGFALNSGINYYPIRWLGLGVAGKNIVKPEEELFSARTTDLLAGVSLVNSGHFRIVSDFYFRDILEEKGKEDIINKSGMEISVHDALKIRSGIEEKQWSMGLGIDSKHITFDYAYTPDRGGLHFMEAGINFGMAPSRKEKELAEKEKRIEKDKLYLEALRDFGAGRMAAADIKVNRYIELHGRHERIESLDSDIKQWLDEVRQEKMGRARELEKEILKAYYREHIEKARVLMDNLKLIAPQYEEALYLEHLLNARVLLEEGRYEEAEDELVQALKINPDSQDVRDLHRRLREVLRLED